ncbi:hypothetical protein F0H41_15360 [Vibrio cholerae]|uniref:Uncharacterized protein n=1 Tax=Vibrio cholerae TaxID=666 RepID=A0A5B0GU95_VIBCL|nr:hypothetical protein [Vibrio cholerae]RBM46897.1 hypothetical protein DLR66_03150 [Vibrio paracholerae]EGQ9417229.1 hypothetical protein [Vibrio cholerae]EGR0627489.1 hypothetical protein [Vibrio cholerae]EGR1102262.1 hypothetical protein [Vibrio cholerae]
MPATLHSFSINSFMVEHLFFLMLFTIIPKNACLKNNLNCDSYHQNGIFYSIESPQFEICREAL